MDQKLGEETFETSAKIEGFPLAYDGRLNIYVLLDSAYANRLIELHVGNKFVAGQYSGHSWYLHPEEALYMISVMDAILETTERNVQKVRQQSIQRIYLNAKAKDISVMHFYLNLRKKSKFTRRVDRFQLRLKEGDQLWDKRMDELKVFKFYELSEDYKKDESFRYAMVLEPEESIVEGLYGDAEKLKKVLNIGSLGICICSNNDMVFLDIRN